MLEAALLVGAYLLGSIPFGVLIARARGVDIFSVGSGNVGATNVKRALGTGPALVVLVLDVLKGVIPAAAAWQFLGSQEWAFGVGLAAVAGHCLSPFLGFRGGKGIATGLGVLLGSAPLVALSALGVFLISMLVCRWVSLSSMLAAVAAVGFGFLYGCSPILIGFFAAMTAFLIFRHRSNIKRLIEGTEPKFSWGGREPKGPMDRGMGGAEGLEEVEGVDGIALPDPSDPSDPTLARPEGAARV